MVGPFILSFRRLLKGCSRAMMRDEKLYPNPDIFNPERFLDEVDLQTEAKRDPRNYVFGFGRRSFLFILPLLSYC